MVRKKRLGNQNRSLDISNCALSEHCFSQLLVFLVLKYLCSTSAKQVKQVHILTVYYSVY